MAGTLRKSPFFGRLFGGGKSGNGSLSQPTSSASLPTVGRGLGSSSLDDVDSGRFAFSAENAASEDLVNAAAAMLLAAADEVDMPTEWPTLYEGDDGGADDDEDGKPRAPAERILERAENERRLERTASARLLLAVDTVASPLRRRNSYHDLTPTEAAVAPLDRRALAVARGSTTTTPAASSKPATPQPALALTPTALTGSRASLAPEAEAYEDTVDATVASIPQLRRAPRNRQTSRLRAAVQSVVAARRLATLKSELELPQSVEVLSLLTNAAGQPVVASGTVDARLDMMIAEGDPNAQQMYDFLSTYSYFIAAPDLLAKLIDRHTNAATIELPTFVTRSLDGETVELPRPAPRPISMISVDVPPNPFGSVAALGRAASSASTSPRGSVAAGASASGPLGGVVSPRASVSGVSGGSGMTSPRGSVSGQASPRFSSPPGTLGPAAAAEALAAVATAGAADPGADADAAASVVLRRVAARRSTGATVSALAGRASADLDGVLHHWVAERAPVAMPEAEAAGVRRLRVLNVLRTWVTRHPEDFVRHPAGDALRARLAEFVNARVLPNTAEARYGRSILELLRQAEATGGRHAGTGAAATAAAAKRPHVARFVDEFVALTTPEGGGSAGSLVLLQKPQSLAQQLTLVEKDMFSRVYQSELVMQGWAKSDRATRAPNLLRFILWFNHISTWVSTEVCAGASVKQRVAIIRVFLEVARYCLHYHNFNGVFEIVVGLSSSPVARLKKTWKAMPGKAMEMWEDLSRLITPQGNFAVYRQMLKTSAFPVIPYVGMHMSDLTFAEDGSPSQLQDGRINFFKFHLVGKILNDVRNYQMAEYAFVEDPAVLAWMKHSIRSSTVEQLTKVSRALEPPVDV